MVLNVTLSEKASKALAEFIKDRDENTGWDNLDPNDMASALINLGVAAYKTDCWGHASACITDEGQISLHG